jgi:hypothetical protein
MFHAGAVAPSSDFLLQLLTLGEVGFVGLHLPLFESPVLVGVNAGAGLELGLYAEDVLLELLTPRPLFP